MRGGLPIVRRWTRPPLVLGIAAALLCIVAETLLAETFRQVTPLRPLWMLYLLGIIAISAVWGVWLGVATAAISTIALDYFLLPPIGSLSIGKTDDWTALAIFLAVTLLAGSISKLALLLAVETNARSEADLAAGLARVLLRAPDVKAAQPEAARLLARALGLPYAVIERGEVAGDEERMVFPLRDHGVPVASLIVPAGLHRSALRRLRDRLVPSMEVLLQAARERERVADKQVALRRLATLVAQGAPPGEVFGAVAREAGNVLDAAHVAVARFDPGDMATNVGVWNSGAAGTMPLGVSWPLEKGSVGELVRRTGVPGRVGAFQAGASELMDSMHRMGVECGVGAPVTVGGRLWGAMVVLSSSGSLPDDIEIRLLGFTDLIVTAIVNAESLAKLEASRARVIAAADATRRLIERDLHDGTQQRLVSLMLELRAVEASPPAEPDKVRRLLSDTIESLDEALEDLRGIARGLHPALLSRRGLEPALRALARCSRIPVALNVHADQLSERTEVTAYHVVSEALSNAAEHADASMVYVDLRVEDATVRLSIRDNGKGGADLRRGTGLLSIRDRVEALGGRLDIMSPAGGGTFLFAEIPVMTD